MGKNHSEEKEIPWSLVHFLQLKRDISVPLSRLRAPGCCPRRGDDEHWTQHHGILSKGKSGSFSAFCWYWTIPCQHILKFRFALIFLCAEEKRGYCPFLYWCFLHDALLSSLLFFFLLLERLLVRPPPSKCFYISPLESNARVCSTPASYTTTPKCYSSSDDVA